MANSDKRRFVRLRVAGRIASDVRPSLEGVVMDLSLGGACIEQQEVLQPGWECEVTLQESGGASLRLQARVLWMDAGRMVKRGGDLVLIYRSGLEFVEVTPEQQEALDRILG